jgi:hypothetical protein
MSGRYEFCPILDPPAFTPVIELDPVVELALVGATYPIG